MKKLLVLTVMAAAFAACNNNGSKTETSDTSTIVTQDTQQVVTDTTVKTDTINHAPDDSNH